MADHSKNPRKSYFNSLSENITERPKAQDYAVFVDTYTPEARHTHMDDVHRVSPTYHSVSDHLALVKQTRDLIKEYTNMKGFILDVHLKEVAQNAGILDQKSQNKMRRNIAKEMHDLMEGMTNLANVIARTSGPRLEKDLAHNELRSLTHDVSYRLMSYKRYYQSYLTDKHYGHTVKQTVKTLEEA